MYYREILKGFVSIDMCLATVPPRNDFDYFGLV
jgi:hypothetical protein